MPPVRTTTASPLQVPGSTGPRASAPSFGSSASGLAQGISSVAGGIESVARGQQIRKAQAEAAKRAAEVAKAQAEAEKEQEDKFNDSMIFIEASSKIGVGLAENPNMEVNEFNEFFSETTAQFRDAVSDKDNFDYRMGSKYADIVPRVASASRARKISSTVSSADKVLSDAAVDPNLEKTREMYYGFRPAYKERLKTFGDDIMESRVGDFEYQSVMLVAPGDPDEAEMMLKNSEHISAPRVEELERLIERSRAENDRIDMERLREAQGGDMVRAWDGEADSKMVVSEDMFAGDKDLYGKYVENRRIAREAGEMLRKAQDNPKELEKILAMSGDKLHPKHKVALVAADGMDGSRPGASSLLKLFKAETLEYIYATSGNLIAEESQLDVLNEQYEFASDQDKPKINAEIRSVYQDLNSRLVSLQVQLGSTSDDIRLLRSSEAKESVAKINSRNPQDGLNELMNLEYRHGDSYWPVVFNQLVAEGLAPSAFMAYNYKDTPGIRETVMEAIRNDKSFEKEDRNAVRERVGNNPSFSVYSHMLSGGDVELQSGIMGFVESFTLQLMQNRPSLDVKEAEQLAERYLIEDHMAIEQPAANDQDPIIVFRQAREGSIKSQRTDQEIDEAVGFLDIAPSFLNLDEIDADSIVAGLPTDRIPEKTVWGEIGIVGTSQKDAVEAFLQGADNYRWESDGHGVYLRIEELKGGDSFQLSDKNGKRLYIDFDNPFGGGKTHWPMTSKNRERLIRSRDSRPPVTGKMFLPPSK